MRLQSVEIVGGGLLVFFWDVCVKQKWGRKFDGTYKHNFGSVLCVHIIECQYIGWKVMLH